MNLSALDLNLLRVLDAILSEGSTVRAGEKIGLSQPAVSAALGRLRQTLGDPLFVRRGQGLEPTDYARALKDPLRDALDGLHTLLDRTGAFDPALSQQTFRISGSDFFAEMLMPQLAGTLSRIAPGVRLQLVDVLRETDIARLRDDNLDLALLPSFPVPDWVGQQHLFDSSLAVVARNDHPSVKAAGLVAGTTFPMRLFCSLSHALCSPNGNLHGLGDRALAAVGRHRRVVLSLPSFNAVANAVAQSDLIALLPEQHARRMAPMLGLSLYTPPMPVAPVRLAMIWHHRSSNSQASRWLREQVQAVLKP